MLRILTLFVALSILTVLTVPSTFAQSKNVKNHVSNFVGKEYWLKIDLVEVNFGFVGTDAANVFSNGEVSYRAKIGSIFSRQVQSQDAEDFAEEARIQLAKDKKNKISAVRRIQRGAKVGIRKAEAKKKEVYVELDKSSGARHAVHLKIDRGNYTTEEVNRLFQIAFAEKESELAGAETTVRIQMGMSVEQIIDLKGKPENHVELGPKTILTYPDLKLIFKDGLLVDVQ